MPGEPPTFPRLEPEAVPLPPARRRRGRQNGRRRPGRSPNDIRHIPLTTWRKSLRQVGTTVSFAPLPAEGGLSPVSLAPGGKSCFLWCRLRARHTSQDANPLFRQQHHFLREDFPRLPRKNRGERSPTSPTIPNGRRVRRRQRNRSATSASEPTLRQPYRFILRRSRTSFLSRDDTACSEAAFPRGKAAPAAPLGPVRAARSAGRRL